MLVAKICRASQKQNGDTITHNKCYKKMKQDTNLSDTNKLARKVRGMNIQDVVDNPEWQKVRVWLKGKWASRGEECTNALKKYFNKDKSDPYRVRRVLNYLTCSGFRTGAIKEKSAYEFREVVRDTWKKLIG